jgi:hypothetical protein
VTDHNPNVDPPMPDGYDQVHIPIADPLKERAGNQDDQGIHHFAVIPPGAPDGSEDFCGGCGQSWPCDKATHLVAAEMPDVR